MARGQQQQPPTSAEHGNPAQNNTKTNRRIARWTFVYAVSTVFIGIANAVFAYFSWGQWSEMRSAREQTERAIVASNKLAEAATQQAQAIIAAQSPVVVFVDIQLLRQVMKDNGPIALEPVTDNIPTDNSLINVIMVNIGTVAGVFREICVEWHVTDVLPISPLLVCEKKKSINYAIRAGETHGFWVPESSIVLTKSQREEIEIHRQKLWIYGYISYQELSGNLVDMGLVAHWEDAAHTPTHVNAFMLDGPPGYAYIRKHDVQPNTQ